MLIINSEYPPVGAGAGNASANIAERLEASGNEVAVVTAGHGDLPQDETVRGVLVLRGPARRRLIDRSTASEQVAFILGATARCLGVVGRFRPDVVLAFFGLPSGAVAWLLKLVFRIPYVVSLRGGDVPGFRPYDFWLYHRIAVPFLRVIWHGASGIVANSKGLRELARKFDHNTKIEVIPNGVDVGRFQSSSRNWSAPRILSAGRAVHQKGLDIALAALSGLKDLRWEWRIAGDGPQLESLKAMIAREGVQDRVRLLGWQSADNLVEEYRGASLFVFPSRHEGMPNAVLEAMASGLPVVASRIAGNEELVLPGETGFLVPPDDPDALRDAVRQLLKDEAMRERMGRAGQARAATHYNWSTVAREYQLILEKAAP